MWVILGFSLETILVQLATNLDYVLGRDNYSDCRFFAIIRCIPAGTKQVSERH